MSPSDFRADADKVLVSITPCSPLHSVVRMYWLNFPKGQGEAMNDLRARLDAVERRGYYGPAGRDLLRVLRSILERNKHRHIGAMTAQKKPQLHPTRRLLP